MIVFWRHLRSTQLLQSKSAAVSHSIFPALYIISYLTSVCSLVLWTVRGLMFTTDCTLSVFRLKIKCLTRYDTGASGALPPLWPCGTLLTAAAVRRFRCPVSSDSPPSTTQWPGAAPLSLLAKSLLLSAPFYVFSVTQGGAESPPPLVEVNQAIKAWSF